jgi:ABC-type amino acid transport substrate-binding protein
MRKGIAALLLGLMLVLAACSGAKPAEPVKPAEPAKPAAPQLPARIEAIKKSGKLTVGTANTRPFEYHDEKSNKLVGFDVDVAEKIAAAMGVTIDWKEMQFAGLVPALQAGQVDMVIAAMYITDARKEVVDFAEPYVATGLVMVTRKDDDSVKTLKDLAKKTVGVKLGSTGAKAAEKLKAEGTDLTVKTYNETLDSLQDLIYKRADVVFNDKMNTLEFIKTHPEVKIVGDPFDPASLGIAVKKGDADLLAQINTVVKDMKAKGEFDKLMEKWLK